MVTRREGFQRIYDLTERVLPEGIDTTLPDDHELGRFLVRRALGAHGFAREKTVSDHIQAAGRKVVKAALFELTDSGEVVEISVNGRGGYFANRKALEDIDRKFSKSSATSVRILSPFDNLLIQRDRIFRLFDFDYALECYKPRKKRKYGYFVLPVLWKNALVARLDAKAYRKKKVLRLRDVWLEHGFRANRDFLKSFSEKLFAFARFNGCSRLEVERTSPGAFLQPLKKRLERNEPERTDD